MGKNLKNNLDYSENILKPLRLTTGQIAMPFNITFPSVLTNDITLSVMIQEGISDILNSFISQILNTCSVPGPGLSAGAPMVI